MVPIASLLSTRYIHRVVREKWLRILSNKSFAPMGTSILKAKLLQELVI